VNLNLKWPVTPSQAPYRPFVPLTTTLMLEVAGQGFVCHIHRLIFDISVLLDTEVDHGKRNDETRDEEHPCGDEDIPKTM
jgi:hypothetical protein